MIALPVTEPSLLGSGADRQNSAYRFDRYDLFHFVGRVTKNRYFPGNRPGSFRVSQQDKAFLPQLFPAQFAAAVYYDHSWQDTVTPGRPIRALGFDSGASALRTPGLAGPRTPGSGPRPPRNQRTA